MTPVTKPGESQVEVVDASKIRQGRGHLLIRDEIFYYVFEIGQVQEQTG